MTRFLKGGPFISFFKREFQLRLENLSDVSCEEKRYVKRLKILSDAIFERGSFRQFFQTRISAAFRKTFFHKRTFLKLAVVSCEEKRYVKRLNFLTHFE